MTKRALLTGIGGQDGSYLAELLLSKGYEVYGIVRRHSVAEHQSYRLADIAERITTYYGDMTDYGSLVHAIQQSKPTEIFHLASQSHVRISFDVPIYTTEVNAIGTLKMLEAYRNWAPTAAFYFAASSECFGHSCDSDGYQRETTPMNPTSPYGIAKVFGFNATRHYRRAYGLFAANGILFNHGSPRRASNFVTAKVVMGALDIANGKRKTLALGNLDSHRDWGFAGDYVKAMWMMLQHGEPDDWVIASGKTRSVRDLCKHVFGRLGLDYGKHITQDQRYMRPEELPYLRGDSSKARSQLGWEPTHTFEETMDEIIEHHRRLRE
jgi:GDPmannose 4,6-dehydratase